MSISGIHPGQTRVEISRPPAVRSALLSCDVYVDGAYFKPFVVGEKFVTYLPDGYHVFQVSGNRSMDEVSVCCDGRDTTVEIGTTRSLWHPRFTISQI